jgi:hypothetical protein
LPAPWCATAVVAYNGIGKDRQACLAHIITKAKEISREQALLPESEMDALPPDPSAIALWTWPHDSAWPGNN